MVSQRGSSSSDPRLISVGCQVLLFSTERICIPSTRTFLVGTARKWADNWFEESSSGHRVRWFLHLETSWTIRPSGFIYWVKDHNRDLLSEHLRALVRTHSQLGRHHLILRGSLKSLILVGISGRKPEMRDSGQQSGWELSSKSGLKLISNK